MKAYSPLDLMNMDLNSLKNIQAQLNKALNISPQDQKFLSDVEKIANAQRSVQDLRKIIGFRADSVDIDRVVDSLYDEAIKIMDQAIIKLNPAEMTTWKSLNNVIEGNLRHN